MKSSNLNSQERQLQQMLEEKVPSFLHTDDLLERLNKAMALFRFAITSRYPPTTIQEGKVDIGKALDVSLVVTESNETESKKQDTSSRSGNDADADNADVRPIYDEEPMAETTYLLANNADLKAQNQEKIFAIAALKNDLRKLRGNSVDTKFATTSVLRKPILQSLRNQSVVRQLNAFKSERPQMSKPQFAS
uniref:Uncharacterized protein n=1 Tax=Tanacetum cinerariifolium TaxID=118510 RepID=A0A6L2JGP9_TANCI|nr:hypothetical protein [Tanacetum cinerariifolium]